jgi:hypothetical protein
VTSLLTREQIGSAINALPIQGRIMLHLLLIQYFDVSQEEIEYMAMDRPDPRMQTGMKTAKSVISRETIQGIIDRVAEYQSRMRQRRERSWLQGECLRKQIARTESLCAIAERLLSSRFGRSPETLKELKAHARTALPKPAIRELNALWDRNEIEEEEYRARRLSVEYQTHLRRLDRLRKRLDGARRDSEAANMTPLQDHEIGHIWGIPASSLAARKVKYLPQYLQAVQQKIRESVPPSEERLAPQVDLWKLTFMTLAQSPVERSVASYDGAEGSEAALIDKLTALAGGTLPEEAEGRFWTSLIQESLPAAEYSGRVRSLFGLQRLNAILSEMDDSLEGLEEELLALASPPRKIAEPAEEPRPAEPQLSEMGQHILRSMMGEESRA